MTAVSQPQPIAQPSHVEQSTQSMEMVQPKTNQPMGMKSCPIVNHEERLTTNAFQKTLRNPSHRTVSLSSALEAAKTAAVGVVADFASSSLALSLSTVVSSKCLNYYDNEDDGRLLYTTIYDLVWLQRLSRYKHRLSYLN